MCVTRAVHHYGCGQVHEWGLRFTNMIAGWIALKPVISIMVVFRSVPRHYGQSVINTEPGSLSELYRKFTTAAGNRLECGQARSRFSTDFNHTVKPSPIVVNKAEIKRS